jgi:hypothetical protein
MDWLSACFTRANPEFKPQFYQKKRKHLNRILTNKGLDLEIKIFPQCRGCSSVVEYLPSMCEALDSIFLQRKAYTKMALLIIS